MKLYCNSSGFNDGSSTIIVHPKLVVKVLIIIFFFLKYVSINIQDEFIFRIDKELYIWQHSYFVNDKELYFKDDVDGIGGKKNYSEAFCVEFIYS